MEYTTIQGTGLRVSKMCLGTMMFGGQTSNEESVEIVRYALRPGKGKTEEALEENMSWPVWKFH